MKSNGLRFEELVSNYLDATLAPEQEYELLQYLESPVYAEAFKDLMQLNGEIAGLVAAPTSDEKMVELVQKEIARKSNRESRVCSAIMDEIHRGPAHVNEVAFVRQVPLITKPTFPWAMVISVGFHAALVMLIVGMQIFLRVEPPKTAEVQPQIVESPTLARVDAVTGDAYSIQNSEKKAAHSGNDLAEGEVLETMGANSAADLKFADGTVLALRSDTRVRQAVSNQLPSAFASGKRIYLERGILNAQVAKQPEGMPMSLVTPNAEATIIGTRFVLSSVANETRLEVTEGVVRLTRLFDHKSILVNAGEFALVTPGVELAVKSLKQYGQFFRGVNFYGGACTIEGNRWMAQVDAEANGLKIEAPPSPVDSHVMNVTPLLPVDAETRRMLNSRLYAYGSDLGLKQKLPNGEYEVYLWIFECAGPYMRSFDIEMNGTIVKLGAGKFKLGEYQKVGPYRAKIVDGQLNLRFKKVQGNPAISGMAIFSVDPSGN